LPLTKEIFLNAEKNNLFLNLEFKRIGMLYLIQALQQFKNPEIAEYLCDDEVSKLFFQYRIDTHSFVVFQTLIGGASLFVHEENNLLKIASFHSTIAQAIVNNQLSFRRDIIDVLMESSYLTIAFEFFRWSGPTLLKGCELLGEYTKAPGFVKKYALSLLPLVYFLPKSIEWEHSTRLSFYKSLTLVIEEWKLQPFEQLRFEDIIANLLTFSENQMSSPELEEIRRKFICAAAFFFIKAFNCNKLNNEDLFYYFKLVLNRIFPLKSSQDEGFGHHITQMLVTQYAPFITNETQRTECLIYALIQWNREPQFTQEYYRFFQNTIVDLPKQHHYIEFEKLVSALARNVILIGIKTKESPHFIQLAQTYWNKMQFSKSSTEWWLSNPEEAFRYKAIFLKELMGCLSHPHAQKIPNREALYVFTHKHLIELSEEYVSSNDHFVIEQLDVLLKKLKALNDANANSLNIITQ